MILVRKMKVYIDVVFTLNFFFDLLLLLGVKKILKRKTSTIRLILGSIIGELSCIALFLPLSTISLILVKLLASTLMVMTSFRYLDFSYFKKNMIYFYLLSIILGGIIYCLKLSLKTSSTDLLTNLIILVLIAPYLLYKYLKEQRVFKTNYDLRHEIEIYLNKKKYHYTAYLDTGNKLEDPYKKRPIILVYDKNLNFTYENSILVPYKTLENEGLLKCQKVDKVIIDQKIELTNILVGKSQKKFNIEGIQVILPNMIKEEL